MASQVRMAFAKLHKPEEKGEHKHYFTLDADGYIQLECIWTNARKKTTMVKIRDKRLDKILQR